MSRPAPGARDLRFHEHHRSTGIYDDLERYFRRRHPHERHAFLYAASQRDEGLKFWVFKTWDEVLARMEHETGARAPGGTLRSRLHDIKGEVEVLWDLTKWIIDDLFPAAYDRARRELAAAYDENVRSGRRFTPSMAEEFKRRYDPVRTPAEGDGHGA